MKSNIGKIVLWLKNGKIREIEFLPNKINVITGDSNTGKTAILHIVDYCFFSSKVYISESIINENVDWYGLILNVNGKVYTLARKAPSNNQPSYVYYFSSTGEIPATPFENNNEGSIKDIIEADYSIDRDVKIPYGGKSLKVGSKISLRYFLMFTTMSQDIIANSEVYFDKQSDDKYREALPRIFDLAVGIDSVENILKREKRDELEKELKKLSARQDKASLKGSDITAEVLSLVKTAKEYGLLSPDADAEISLASLQKSIASAAITVDAKVSTKVKENQKEIFALRRKIVNLRKFGNEYSSYKDNLSHIGDSLKPVVYLMDHYSEMVQTSIFNDVFTAFEDQIGKIKLAIKSKTPIDTKVNELVGNYETRIRELYKELDFLPTEVKTFQNQKEAYIFIGEAKTKLDMFLKSEKLAPVDHHNQILELEKEIAQLHVRPVEDGRNLFVDMLQEMIQSYINIVKAALGNYASYHPVFNYRSKQLNLRKPKADFIEIVGSSSNHMFLHLFLFLGLHEVVMKKEIPFVPSFLIIDQPSRPYYGDEGKEKKELDHTDEFKIKKAFELLDKFVDENCVKEGYEFQAIVFEHIPVRLVSGMRNVHVVEVFTDGNALIPESYLP